MGETNATSSGRLELWLLKIGSQGSMEGSRTYAASGNVMGSCVIQTSDGGYAVACSIQSTPPNPQDMTSYVWIGKLDANGNHSIFIPEFPPNATLIVAVLISLFALALKKRHSSKIL